MNILVLGVSHKSAPVKLREKLALSPGEIGSFIAQVVKDHPEVTELAVLSTCNRVEIYGVANSSKEGFSTLLNFLSRYHHLPKGEFEKCFYRLTDYQAIKHIFRVASSLDSLVVGEPQILGQVKEAYREAKEGGFSGFYLDRLFHRAFQVAKKVRTETRIGEQAVSVSHAAGELAKKVLGPLKERSVLLVGTGEMAKITARYLISQGVRAISVTSRTLARAEEFAQQFRARCFEFSQLQQAMEQADIVITSTGAPHPIVKRELVQKCLRARRQRPIFIVDIAVPRDVEEVVNQLDNVYLYDIDDLQEVAEENLRERQGEAKRAEDIVERESQKFYQWMLSLDLTPTITTLREKIEGIRQQEWQKALSRLRNLPPPQREIVEALTQSLVNKILHQPIINLKRKAQGEEKKLFIDALRVLFSLDGEDITTENTED